MIINGTLNQNVAISDRGFNFGDGHFTTIKLAAGQALLLDLHLARLQHACAILAIEFNQWHELITTINQQAKELQQGVLKVTITRGEGGRGYGTIGCSRANWFLQYRPIPANYSEWASTGIELMICQYQQTVNPILAGLKTLNRLDQVMIKQELEAKAAVDGLVCSTDGYVIETSVANIFWVIAGQVYTPSTIRSGIEGVMKTHISSLLNNLGLTLNTGDYTMADMWVADEIFITNAVMEVVPVNAVVNHATKNDIDDLNYTICKGGSSVWRQLQLQLQLQL